MDSRSVGPDGTETRAPDPGDLDVDPAPSVRGDQLRQNRKPNRGRGSRTVHTRGSIIRPAADILIAYKWPLSAAILAIIAGLIAGPVSWLAGLVPDLAWSVPFYGLMGLSIGILPSYLLWRYISVVRGVEVLDIDPVGGDHRHLRIGWDLWDDLTVLTPWGRQTSTDDLQQCTINGRTGFELMDFRVTEDGDPVAVATWMGEADSAMLRTYKSAVTTARKRMSEKAQRNIATEANKAEIAREAAERVIMWQMRTAESSGVPNGEAMNGVIDDVLSDYGLDDPLAEKDLASPPRSRDPEQRDTSDVPRPENLMRNDGGREPL